MFYGLGSDLGVVLGGSENFSKQLPVDHVVLLVNPEGLQEVVGMGLVLGVELLEPLFGFPDHVVGVALAQFDAGPVADDVGRILEVIQKGGDGLPVD